MIDLRQGDCLELMKDIPDKSIDCIICDLPYGTTACKWDVIIPFNKLWEQYNRIIKPHGAIVLFGSQPFTSMMIASNVKKYKHSWIWNKNAGANFMNVKYMPFKVHEDIVVFSSGGKVNYYPQMIVGKERLKGGYHAKQTIYGDESNLENKPAQNNLYYPKSILTFSNADKNNKLHPTQKPVALIEYLIKTYTNENDVVLDNCMGSGTTAVACINTNRNFIGIELDEKYFNIAKERIEKARNKWEDLD